MASIFPVLALNTGSSSLKFAFYEFHDDGQELLRYSGSLTRIGPNGGGKFVATDDQKNVIGSASATWKDMDAACEDFFAWLKTLDDSRMPRAIGHRIVHGGQKYSRAHVVDEELIATLHTLAPYAPEHIPPALRTLHHTQQNFPSLLQIACFDTAFHRTMPEVASIYSLPEQYRQHGLQKYGFHGLSYDYMVSEMKRIKGGPLGPERIVVAHLGHGASMCAIENEKCADTTMGFSPTGGLVMTTRVGDIDPEIVLFLLQHENLTPSEIKDILNKKSGLMGLSAFSDDIRDLLAAETTNPKAKLALDVFVYHAKKHLSALVSTMSGIDTLVFTAGIGEKSPDMRRRICHGLQYLGIELDEDKNNSCSDIISSERSRVTVRVISTNEELVIARQAGQLARNVIS